MFKINNKDTSTTSVYVTLSPCLLTAKENDSFTWLFKEVQAE